MADCVSPPTRSAKARIVIDMAFDDAVEPGLLEMDLSVLHDLPAPHLRAYAREMVIAEKFQAMVMLGRANIRGARGLSLARRFGGVAHAAVIRPRRFAGQSILLLLPPE
ncbi:nucleotidyl transferase AbiEii/AbiGii toxin family protein [Bradyrhizobium niftali]|jgi:Nucleotidyl transferase AbiEii toxin, Type IV TA system|uniref:Uncharacterized protein n=1 Tax=Bradyrhizobium niftali TaxID=2560055 RepID=A0A4Y9LZM1_9BRAD|nr:nucleotidyl transferase AbiEii/AbiGii toxin family protein [Bradyrhizobium niftali]TFV48285.1 hypothetical protein E4K65_12785 [Bradyrhizobium niftali]